MNKKSKTDVKKDEASRKKLTIDLGELYKYNAKDLQVDITAVKHSNLSWIQVSPRDVSIDFLEMPGVKKDDKMMINGTRIYMSHVSAQKLSEVIDGLLQKVHSRGDIEQLSFKKK